MNTEWYFAHRAWMNDATSGNYHTELQLKSLKKILIA